MDTDYTKYKLSVRQKRNFLIVSYLLIMMLCLLFYHSLFLSAVCGALSVFLIDPYSRYMAEKRRALLLTQFKDLLYSMSASIATGRMMSAALEEGLENLKLIYDEDTPLVRELKYIVRSVGENRGHEQELLADFARRSGCEDIRNFVDVYAACRQTGGNMERVIAEATEVLTEKMTIEREIKALTSQKKFEGNIIITMPIAVVMLLNVVSPDYLQVMYQTLAGRLVMTLALAVMAAAYILMIRLTRIEV